MHFEIQKINDKIVKESEKYFSDSFTSLLKKKITYEESIVARYLISKYVENKYKIKNFLPEVNESGRPIFSDTIYWSISHKEKKVCVGISDKPIGVDLENYKIRDISLLEKFGDDTYKLFGSKTWENFYKIWTGLESVIKTERTSIDKIGEYKIVDVVVKNNIFSGIKFQYEMIVEYSFIQYIVFLGKKEKDFYSISFVLGQV
ncbi:MAG: hypothetical protein GY828_07950 [Candidatus Gracilibacteria bacterium]|nr:hypothetical protein [Candidatus Gracilibacteria bacterium]